jgi:hypothetical protein
VRGGMGLQAREGVPAVQRVRACGAELGLKAPFFCLFCLILFYCRAEARDLFFESRRKQK